MQRVARQEIKAMQKYSADVFLESSMTAALDDLVPSAADCRKTIALAEAEKASALMRREAAAEAEKKELLERLEKPSGVSDEERLKRAASIIQRAVDNGLTEVFVGRFPNMLFTDRGRAINQQEPGWENTLTGLPRELYEFWAKYLKQRGYRLRVQIVDWPGGMPGDIGITLAWG
jgi:hypothetical protein